MLVSFQSTAISFFNEGTGVVEISFNGSTVHSELNPNLGTSNVTISNSIGICRIWFRLKSGAVSTVRVQTNAEILTPTVVNTTVTGTVNATNESIGSNDISAPSFSTQIGGVNSSGNLEPVKVFDLDTAGTTEYNLGVSLRLPSSGGSVVGGTATNPIRIDPTGTTTQPISGTISVGNFPATTTVIQSTAGNLNATVVGAVIANIGTTNGLALDSTLSKLTIAQNTNLGSNTQILVGGSVANSVPSYTTGQINPLSLTTSGALRVDGTANIQPIRLGDSSSSDAFGRIRVSSPFTLFESKQLFDNRSIIWSTKLTSGGTSTYDSNRASSILAVTTTIGSQVIRQTKSRFTYQNGKGLQILSTFVMGTTPGGVLKRVGYFDDSNGIYLQVDGSTVSAVIRSSVTGSVINTVINQTSWNIDTFNGSGPSGITLDITKAQIFVIDFQWLGTGRVRVGFSINGVIYYGHQFLNANILTSVYMSTPNLPMRYEITNNSSVSTSSIEQICSTVLSEGGFENKGYVFSADRGVSVLANVTNLAIFPLISIRLDTTKLAANIAPEGINVLCTTGGATFRWVLIMNPTIAGADAASWNSVPNSAVQYDVSRTISNTLIGGTLIHSGYSAQGTAAVDVSIPGLITLGIDLANTADQLVLGVQKIDGGADSFISAMTWRELV